MICIFRFVIGLLSILENSFSLSHSNFVNQTEQYLSNRTKATNIALKLLNHSTQACIQLHSKTLVAVLNSTNSHYLLKVCIKVTFIKNYIF